jgi:hypothetical protein
MDGMVSWEGGIAGAMELIAGGTCSNDAMDGRLSWEGGSAEGALAIAGGGSAWRKAEQCTIRLWTSTLGT